MKLRIGDKVRFLNEVGEGVVSGIKNSKTVMVEMQDGFEIPFPANQLVPIHTELILESDGENIAMDPEAHAADAVYFIIEPDHVLQQLVTDYKIYLFNASSYHLLYSYSIKDKEYFQTIKHGEAGPYQKIFLKQVKKQYFSEYSYHKTECILFKNTFFKAQIPVSEALRISPSTLQETKPVKHDEFKLPVHAFILKTDFSEQEKIEQQLSPEDIERLKAVKEFRSKQKTSKSHKEYLRSLEKEVDLHIEELIENASGLSNFEMLGIQLERFTKELDEAMEKGMRKIIFIHGVGNGRLRQEIHSVLKTTKGISFQDASYKEYGYGATQVNIL